ncbi:hypothetical protein [Chitinophaga sp.]|uniref:hypothetical protein n=1 Tax=Chitinophaga sp. TaxID=1869181 RepID=UPI0031D269A9
MKHFLLHSIFFICCFCRAVSQDTATVSFLGRNVTILPSDGSVKWCANNPENNDTIISLGADKYFYLKRSNNDSLPVLTGQLGLYKISDQLILFREGFWIVEDEDRKIMFSNNHEPDQIILEYPVSTEPANINMPQRKKSRSKRGGKDI